MVLDYIKIYDFTEDIYNLCVGYSDEMLPALTGAGKQSIRSCSEKYFHPSNDQDTNTEIYKQLEKCTHNIVHQYCIDVPDAGKSLLKQHSGYHLLRYEESEKYDTHVDDFNQVFRRLSVTLNLNDDYEGGEFFLGQKTIKLQKNQALVFPSNFCFPHRVFPVKKGIRWSVVTWYI